MKKISYDRATRVTFRLQSHLFLLVFSVISIALTVILLTPQETQAEVRGLFGWWPVGQNYTQAINTPTSSSTDLPSYVGTYSSEDRSASSPGGITTLRLEADQTVHWITDYQNGEAAIKEYGSWGVTVAGRVVVSITGTSSRTYDRPVVTSFEHRDDSLIGEDYDPARYGSAGIQFWRK